MQSRHVPWEPHTNEGGVFLCILPYLSLNKISFEELLDHCTMDNTWTSRKNLRVYCVQEMYIIVVSNIKMYALLDNECLLQI